VRVWPFAVSSLNTQQQTGHAADNRRGETASCEPSNAAAGNGTGNIFAGSKDSIGSVSLSPVVCIQRPAVCAQCADGKNSGQSGRNMEALATVVPDGGDNQNVVPLTQSNCACQDIVRLATW
jgi:hypothetical protein